MYFQFTKSNLSLSVSKFCFTISRFLGCYAKLTAESKLDIMCSLVHILLSVSTDLFSSVPKKCTIRKSAGTNVLSLLKF
jgi:hypothetical protein